MRSSLWPREHGIYVEVIAPQLTALLLSPTLAAGFFSTAILASFLLYEPLFILRGGRGGRAKATLGGAAKKRFGLLLMVVIAAGAWGAFLAPSSATAALLAPGVCGALSLSLAWRRAHKTLVGELLVALTFSLAFVPVALTSSGPQPLLWIVGGIWMAVFGLQTLTIHAVKARGGLIPRLAITTASFLVVCTIVGMKTVTPVLIALTGPALLTIAVVARRMGPAQMRRIGWAFACADTTTLVLILFAWPD